MKTKSRLMKKLSGRVIRAILLTGLLICIGCGGSDDDNNGYSGPPSVDEAAVRDAVSREYYPVKVMPNPAKSVARYGKSGISVQLSLYGKRLMW